MLTGPFEPTNEWYAVAKVAGVKLCQAYRRQYGKDFIAVVPTNLYGPGENFDLASSHVVPALIRRFHEAKVAGAPYVELWGTGKAVREYLYVDDAADAFLRAGASEACNGEVFNVGGDEPISIRDLTSLLLRVAGSGSVAYIEWPADKKAIDIGDFYSESRKFRRATGWQPAVSLPDGLQRTVAFYRKHLDRYLTPADSRPQTEAV